MTLLLVQDHLYVNCKVCLFCPSIEHATVLEKKIKIQHILIAKSLVTRKCIHAVILLPNIQNLGLNESTALALEFQLIFTYKSLNLFWSFGQLIFNFMASLYLPTFQYNHVVYKSLNRNSILDYILTILNLKSFNRNLVSKTLKFKPKPTTR